MHVYIYIHTYIHVYAFLQIKNPAEPFRRNELVPLAYTDDVGAPKVAQIETVFPRLGLRDGLRSPAAGGGRPAVRSKGTRCEPRGRGTQTHTQQKATHTKQKHQKWRGWSGWFHGLQRQRPVLGVFAFLAPASSLTTRALSCSSRSLKWTIGEF